MHKPWKFSSIRTKISMSALFIKLFLISSISLILLSGFRSMLRDMIFEQQFSLVSELAGQLDSRLRMANTQLYMTAARLNSTNVRNPVALSHILDDKEDIKFVFDAGLLIFDSHGIVLAENMGQPELVGQNLLHRDYVRETLRDKKPHLSAPFRLNSTLHSPMIAMTQPVRDDADNLIAIVVGYHALGSGNFLTSLSSKNKSEGYRYIAFDRVIIEHPDKSRIMEVVPPGKNVGLDRAISGFEGSLDNINSKGERMLSSFSRIGDSRLILAANTPYNLAFAKLIRLNYITAAVALIGAILASILVWIITRYHTKPIISLTQHMDNSGDWKPILINTGDEVQKLAESYNQMMDEVQRTRSLLIDEKEFFGSIIQNSAVPMFIIDNKHSILFWNNAMAQMTGLSSIQMVGTENQWQPFYAAKRPVLADLIIDKSASSTVDTFYENNSRSEFVNGALRAEGWYDQLGGKRRYIFFEAAPIRNRNNEIVAAVETLEDITERRLLEESLGKLTRAVEQSPATIVITNVEGSIEYVNPKFSLTTGYTFEEAMGQNPRILKSGELDAQSYSDLWTTISSGKEWRGEFHNKRKDGTLYWEFASISPLTDKNGKVSGYLAVKEDITARKAVEKELAESRRALEANHTELESLFALVEQGKREWEDSLDHLKDIILLVDSEHRVRRFNRLLADITGRAINEVVGSVWQDLLKDAGFKFTSFNGKSGELLHTRSARIFDVSVYEIVNDSILEGHVISLNDTTELRSTTQELEKAYAELKEAQMQIFQQEKMASIGQLAAGVAHEINNPMGFISSNLSTLNKYIDRLAEFIGVADQSLCVCAGSDEAVKLKEVRKRLKVDYVIDDSRQLIAESQDGAGRVRRIVQDLKSFSRVDQAECALVDLNESLETTINIAWNEIKYVATLNREFGEIPHIKCFPQQLNQVFLNLLVNAGHAMGEQLGSITIRTWYEDGNVFVSVADTGCGIQEDIKQRIFEPFFTTKDVGKGTGLGLSISYDIIKKHGGEITVDSMVGKGSTFIVRLPESGPASHSQD